MRIAVWGDSNVVDDGAVANGSFRIVLVNALNATSHPATIIGPYSDAYTQHTGQNGWGVAQLTNLVPSVINTRVDVHILHAGTNDLLQPSLGYNDAAYRDATPTRMKAFAQEILRYTPNAFIYVCSIPKAPAYPASLTWMPIINAGYSTICAELRASNFMVFYADSYAATLDKVHDGVHYNQAGKDALATVLYTAMIDRANQARPMVPSPANRLIRTMKGKDLDIPGLKPFDTYRIVQ